MSLCTINKLVVVLPIKSRMKKLCLITDPKSTCQGDTLSIYFCGCYRDVMAGLHGVRAPLEKRETNYCDKYSN